MSFPSEPLIIQPEEILGTDIIIEDRKLVAVEGNESATQASNAAAKSSFYSQLIVSLADSIRSKENTSPDKTEWNLDSYKLATDRIINLVGKTKTSTRRRFVWYRQFPEAHYLVMTRTQTINKIANDLDCQMRKIKARELSRASETSKQRQKPSQRRYAQRLIMKVCRAVWKGMSQYQAALLLDHPIVTVQGSGQNISDEMNAEGVEAPEKSNHESELERKLRLQIRHRFLACVRSKKCIFDLANALLTMWGFPSVSKIAPKPRKRSEPDTTTKANAVPSRKRKVEVIPENHNLGIWNRDERVAFLKGMEKHGVPNWIKIAPFISTRYVFDIYNL